MRLAVAGTDLPTADPTPVRTEQSPLSHHRGVGIPDGLAARSTLGGRGGVCAAAAVGSLGGVVHGEGVVVVGAKVGSLRPTNVGLIMSR